MRYIELKKPIKTEFTGDTVTTIIVAKYTYNGALAMVAANDEGERIANITVNLDESMFLNKNCFFLDASQTANEIKDFWLKEGIIKKINGLRATSGFNSYQAYEILDPSFKDEIRKANDND